MLLMRDENAKERLFKRKCSLMANEGFFISISKTVPGGWNCGMKLYFQCVIHDSYKPNVVKYNSSSNTCPVAHCGRFPSLKDHTFWSSCKMGNGTPHSIAQQHD